MGYPVALTDASGAYRFEGPPAKSALRATFEADGYATESVSLEQGAEIEPLIANAVLFPSTDLRITGTVTDGRTPLQRARVALLVLRESAIDDGVYDDQVCAVTDDTGTFDFYGDHYRADATHFLVEVECRGFARTRFEVDPDAPDLGALTLDPECVLRVTLTDAEQQPVANASVVTREHPPDANALGSRVWRRAQLSRAFPRGRTDSSGQCTLTELGLAVYSVTAHRSRRRLATKVVDLTTGDCDRSVELIANTIHAISGVVIDPSGRPAANARVFCETAGQPGRPMRTSTGPSGAFQFWLRSDMTCRLSCQTEDGKLSAVLVDVAADMTDVELRLRPAVHVRGKIVDGSDQSLIARSVLVVIPRDWQGVTVKRLDDGRFDLFLSRDDLPSRLVAWRNIDVWADGLISGATNFSKHFLDARGVIHLVTIPPGEDDGMVFELP